MIGEIWRSFRRLPGWVQIWVVLILVPVNLAALLFVSDPYGMWVALLAIGGMVPNLAIMMIERGLSKTMSWPHVVIWTPLVVLVAWLLMADGGVAGGHQTFLVMLLIVDLISLAFDYVDVGKWLKGQRGIA